MRVKKNVLGHPTHAVDNKLRQETLTRAILLYCIEHPDAKDTVEGILRWWFPAGKAHWRIDEVKSVLGILTTKGWLASRKVQRSEDIFSINKEKMTEIEKFLSDAKDQGDPR